MSSAEVERQRLEERLERKQRYPGRAKRRMPYGRRNAEYDVGEDADIPQHLIDKERAKARLRRR